MIPDVLRTTLSVVPSTVRTQDRAAATIASLMALALIGQQVAGKAIRDALFLSAFHVSSLAWMMMAASVVSIAASFVFARAMSLKSPAWVMKVGLSTSASAFVLEWWLSAAHPGLVAALVYVHIALFGPALVSGFWSLVNERFDPHAAKSLVGRIGAGASIGAVIGGLLTWLGASRVSVPGMLLGLASFNVVAIVGLFFLRASESEHERARADEEGLIDAGSGLQALRELPYLRNLALLIGLASFTELLVDYAFKAETSTHFSGSSALVAFFGPFYTGLSVMALAIQTLFSKRSLDRLGLSGTVALHPLATALGAAVALIRPGMASLLIARGGNGVLRDSLFRSGYELLYTPLPPERKRATKAVIDVGADKLGAVLGAVVVLIHVGHHPVGVRFLLLAVIATCLIALVVARRLSAGYVAALGESLKAGLVRLDVSEVLDSTTRTSLTHALDRKTILGQIDALQGAGGETSVPGVAAASDSLIDAIVDLRSSRLDRIRMAIKGAYPVDVRLVPFVIPLLGRNDVLPDALRYLRTAAPRCTGLIVDWLLDPETPPVVRRRIPRVLKSVMTPRAVAGLLAGLDDPVFAVRYEAAVALAALTSRDASLSVAPEAVFPRVMKELTQDEGGDRVLDHAFTLLGLVLEREPLRTALRALQTEDRRLRGTALEYLENVVPEDVRLHLWPRIGSGAVQTPPRPRAEVEAELLESMTGIPRSRLRSRIGR
jgi:AAA family ATP:ADP antiporter